MSRPSIQDGIGTSKKPINDEDRISNLPELVISQILSLVPTKDAVRTSVLSRDWEHKWTSIQHIYIDERVLNGEQARVFIRNNSTMVNFANFVERVVRLLQKNITSFCLRLSSPLGSPHGYDLDRVAAWICSVSRRNVKKLKVYGFYGGGVALPHSLLLNGSLTNLELHLICRFKVPARISYPNLKDLNLSFVDIINEPSSTDTLALDFPVLEKFKLHNCRFLNVKMVEVHAPELLTFKCTFPSNQVHMCADYSIKIVSTKLVEFWFSDEVIRKYILIGQQVVYATLFYDWPDKEEEFEAIRIHAQSLLKGFSNLKELSISGSLTMAIAESGVSCPMLHHLVRLVVCADSFYAEGLLKLLQATPVLKLLIIYDMIVCDNDDYDCNAVEPVPPCIKDLLVEIEFVRENESSHQINFVNFLLKNGSTLKKNYRVMPPWIATDPLD